MATVALIEYEDASPEVRAVYDDIREVRQTDFINNFWKGLANNPAQLRRTWEQINNACEYCIHSHTAAARAKGMTDEQYNELLAIIGLAHQTNGLVSALQLEVDDAFKA
jgi:hypothetical protein